MTDLATQIEQAEPAQQWTMLVAAWEHICGEPAVQSERGLIFHRLLSVNTDETFTGAALMLPGKHQREIIIRHDGSAACRMWDMDEHPSQWAPACARASLAIAAACVRAHDAKEEG